MRQCHLIIMSFFIILLTGCINDDLLDCMDPGPGPNPPQTNENYMTFEYTKNKQRVDLFPSMVENVDVYVYDSEGLYVKCISDQGPQLSSTSYFLPIDLPSGTYTFVVWSGARNHYQLFDNYSNSKQSLKPTVTTFDDSRLALNTTYVTDNGFPENLFFGTVEQVSIDAENSRQIHVGLTKDTKNIHITVEGIPYFRQKTTKSDSNYLDIICNLANGEFKFDNSISLPERLFQYHAVNEIYNETSYECDIRTLRLLTDMRSELIIKDPTTQKEIFNDSLIDLLLLSPDINNNVDFDTNDEYNIVISIDPNMETSIKINGYIVFYNDSDL